MKYDFTSVIDRQGWDAMAIEAVGQTSGPGPTPPKDGFDIIPMWIADMNFPTVPTVPDAVINRVKHPAYGYFFPREEYFDAIIHWHESRNGVSGLTKDHIGYQNGVLGGVINGLNAVCSRGDSVLVHAPTYIGFTSSLENSGYRIVSSPLKLDGDNIWRMDFSDMEEKLAKNHIHAAILCSPHNPCSRVWEQWELEKAMALFAKYDVYVLSDEIWSDIIRPGYRHIPTQSVSDDAKMRTIALYAPSKTFNLAGLVGSYHIIYNRWLRDRMNKEASLSRHNKMNLLSMYALIGAYTPEGHDWVNELCAVIAENVDYACDYIQTHFEGVKAAKPEGTYMLFIDCTQWCESHGKSIDDVEAAAWDVGVAVQDGRQFHGPCHLRMNLALPLSRIKEAFARLDRYVFNAQ